MTCDRKVQDQISCDRIVITETPVTEMTRIHEKNVTFLVNCFVNILIIFSFVSEHFGTITQLGHF